MVLSGVLQEVRKRWFIMGVVVVISLAKLFPPLGAKGGPLKPEITVRIVAVSAIFFNSGLSLKTEELTRALGQVKLHVFIQTYTLVLIPIAMSLIVKALGAAAILDTEYLNGLRVVGCMPPPVSSAVILTKAVGGWEFGIVYRARLGPHGRYSQEVAVKTLKGDFDQLDVDKFVEESLKMSRFRHPHVMGLVGVCLDAGSAPYIMMPYMANGSLLQYLRKERKNLVFSEDADKDEVEEVRKHLMVMCSQIASGMEYLAAEKYIHRDLAARNCMIDSHFVIKITDFGLSEDVFLRNYFRQGGDREVVKLPVKWMAPESLSDGHFSEKSDVWSYGVTMWEIFSGGKAPYPGTDPLTLVQRLEEGDRMPKPNNAACTEAIYKMMRKCWEMVPDDRPSFEDLHANTSKYTEHIAGYLEMGFNPFAGANRVKSTVMENEEVGFESAVAIQVTPASLEEESVDKVFTD